MVLTMMDRYKRLVPRKLRSWEARAAKAENQCRQEAGQDSGTFTC